MISCGVAETIQFWGTRVNCSESRTTPWEIEGSQLCVRVLTIATINAIVPHALNQNSWACFS